MTDPQALPATPPDEVASPGRARRLLWALAALALVAAVLLGWLRAWPAHQLAQQRESDAAALAAGRAMAVNFTTLDYRGFAPYKQQILDGATGDFRTQWEQQAAQLQQLVTQNTSTSTPTRTEVALVSADADSAEVIAGIVARTTNSSTPAGETKTYRMDLKLVKVAGEWKVSSLGYVS